MLALPVGCGERTPAPQVVSPASAGGYQTTRYPAAGLRLDIPRNWTPTPVRLPQVALVSSGPAVISVWRYPRASAPPATAPQLKAGLQRLIALARRRNHRLRLVASSTGSLDGHPYLQLETIGRIGLALREDQSTHVFLPGHEVVLEEYAPVMLFPGLERSTFLTVRRSLGILQS